MLTTFICIVVKAYQYTPLTSVMLLDCWSIPSVIFLTWMFLKTKYRFRKFAGIAICVTGLVLVVFSDVHAGDRAGNWEFVSWDLPEEVILFDYLCFSKLNYIFFINSSVTNKFITFCSFTSLSYETSLKVGKDTSSDY